MMKRAFALLLTWCSACVPDTSLPEGVDVACLTDDDCVQDLVCHPTKLRCVASETFDLEQPGLIGLLVVDPPLARVDEDVRVTFTVSEALLVQPVVFLERGSESAIALSPDADASAPAENRYTSVLPAGSVDKDGCAPLSVTLLDRNGNSTSVARAADVCFDASPPALAAPVLVDDAPFAAGDTLTVGLVFTEELLVPPSVSIDDSTGQPFTLAPSDALYPRFYAASLTVPPFAGAHDIVVVAVDRAGNTTTMTVGSVTFE